MTAIDAYSEHNVRQRRYFEEAPKPGMRPRPSRYIERQVDELVRFAALEPGARVLDVGCGKGRYTLPLAARGFRVEGLDIAPRLLDDLRAFAGGRHEIPVHCEDVAAPPAELLGEFDAVVGFFALHHMHDLPASFAGIARLTRPGGRVAFLEPNPFNPLYYVQMLATPTMTWAGDGGLTRMRRGPVFGAMRDAGLRDLALERFGFAPPQVTDRPRGAALEQRLERVGALRTVRPFQLFGGTRIS